MRNGEDDTTIGMGGWGLVLLAAVVTFGVLHQFMHFRLVSSLLFALAIALVVLLLLHRLAAAMNRQEDAEAASRVRRIVPASGVGAAGAVAVPVRPDAVVPQPPSAVVTPLARVEAPPVIAPPVAALPVDVAPADVAQVGEPVAAPVDGAKTRAKAAPKSGAAKPKAAPKPKSAAKPKAAKAAKPKVAAPQGLVRLTAPRDGKADALQEIEGIGPALEKLVNTLGFYHFDQIAGWTAADVAQVDAEMKNFKGRITRDKWVEQALIIVDEGLEAFRERAKTNNY